MLHASIGDRRRVGRQGAARRENTPLSALLAEHGEEPAGLLHEPWHRAGRSAITRRDRRAPIANAPSGEQPRDLAAAPRPAASPDRTLHMIGNAHLDPVWLWPWQEGYQEARATFWSAIDRMDEYPDFVFTCDQIVLLSWVEESGPGAVRAHPRARRRGQLGQRRRLVGRARLQHADGGVVRPPGTLRSALSAGPVRAIATVGMNVDPFGHNAMLPQILRGQRMDSYCFLRPGPHEERPRRDAVLVGVAGRLAGARLPHPVRVLQPAGRRRRQTEKSLAELDRSLGEMMMFYGVGNHGGGPTKANIESIHRYDRMGSFGRMTMSSPREYFDEMLARGEGFLEGLSVRRDDLQHHAPGCYSAHSGIKAWQRRAQCAVLSAERWAAVDAPLARGGMDYPREDSSGHGSRSSSTSSTTSSPARRSRRRTRTPAISWARRWPSPSASSRARTTGSRRRSTSRSNTAPSRSSSSIRTRGRSRRRSSCSTARSRPACARRRRRRPVLVAARQPVHGDDRRQEPGAVVFRAMCRRSATRCTACCPGPAPSRPTPACGDDGTILENAHLRVELDPGPATSISLLDKATGVDPLRAPRAAAHGRVRRPHRHLGPPRHLVRVAGCRHGARPHRGARDRPLRSRVRVEPTWGARRSSRIPPRPRRPRAARGRRARLAREAHLLKLRFPVATRRPAATSRSLRHDRAPRRRRGGARSIVGRPDRHGRRRAGRTHDHREDEARVGCLARPAGRPSIGITAVRSPVYSWHDPRLLDPEGVYSFQDQGIQRFSLRADPARRRLRAAQPTRRAADLGHPSAPMLESSTSANCLAQQLRRRRRPAP